MPIYAMFMKDLLTRNREPKYDKNIALTEECSAIIQSNLLSKLKYPRWFTIPCTTGKLKIRKEFCDLGASINLMPISIMKNLDYGEVKPNQTTLTLADQFITYSYGVLEDVLVKVDDLLFAVDFVILDIDEDA